MNITLVCAEQVPPSGYGGTERVVHWLAQELIARGHFVNLVARPGSGVVGANTIEARNKAEALSRLPADTDIVHFHGWAPKPGQNIDFPALQTVHGNSDLRARPGGIPSVHVSADHAARHDSTLFVYNGIPETEMDLQVEKTTRYLFFSRINRAGKNVSKAISLARQYGFDLDIAGGSRFDLLTRSQVRREGAFFMSLSSRFRFHGMVDGAHKNALFAHARALLFPIRWPEPFGLVVIESLLAGTPVITTPCGSMPELVSPDIGFLCETDDDYARAFQTCGDIPAHRCRDYAVAHFSMTRCADAYLDLYQRVLDGEVLTPQSKSQSARPGDHA